LSEHRSVRKAKQRPFDFLLQLEKGKKQKSFRGRNPRETSGECSSNKMDRSKSSHSPSDSSHLQKFKKVRRRRPTSSHSTTRLERSSVEPVVEEVISEKSDVGTIRESSKERKLNDKKRVKTPSRKLVYPCSESKFDTSELIKENDMKKTLSKNKNFRKKLESMSSYSSMIEKGQCSAIELFKSYGFNDNKIEILFKSLAYSTFLNYQFGWGIFADYVLD
jgi:hypothetical protein